MERNDNETRAIKPAKGRESENIFNDFCFILLIYLGYVIKNLKVKYQYFYY